VKSRRWMAGAAFVAILPLVGAGVAQGQDRLPAAIAAAADNANTPDGKKFTEAVGQAFGREHKSTIQSCAKSVRRPDLSSFSLLLRVNGTGVVDQALVKPRTNLSGCVQGKVTEWKAGVPPREDYWVKIDVNLKR
jgi:hypothetical protein